MKTLFLNINAKQQDIQWAAGLFVKSAHKGAMFLVLFFCPFLRNMEIYQMCFAKMEKFLKCIEKSHKKLIFSTGIF